MKLEREREREREGEREGNNLYESYIRKRKLLFLRIQQLYIYLTLNYKIYLFFYDCFFIYILLMINY